MFNCPKCKKTMQEWDWDIGDDETPPTIVDIIGYGCYPCQLTFIDLDKSNFDGFINSGHSRDLISDSWEGNVRIRF